MLGAASRDELSSSLQNQVLSAERTIRASLSSEGSFLVRGTWRPSWYASRIPMPILTQADVSVGVFQYTMISRDWTSPRLHSPMFVARLRII